MATKYDKPLDAPEIKVEHMPPLAVTREGIPAAEHVEHVETAEVPRSPRENRARMLAWALAGVVGLLVVAAGIFGLTQMSTTPTEPVAGPMGLSTQAWQEYRAGERASSLPGPMGLSAAAWREYRDGERTA